MIGITERGDAALDTSWSTWVSSGKPAVLITKNPTELYKILSNSQKLNIIVHCTITGFGGTKLEPHVNTATNSIKQGFIPLASLLGHERIVLRIDPIIPTELGLTKAIHTFEHAKESFSHEFGYSDFRTRISFIDMYSHVRHRMIAAGIPLPPWTTFHAPIELRRNAFNQLRFSGAQLEICGEPGMECTGCISEKDLIVFGEIDTLGSLSQQRESCRCLGSKHELLTNRKQCANRCIYCYWR